MSSNTFAHRTTAGLFLAAVVVGAGLAATGTMLAGSLNSANSPASYLHDVGTTNVAPDGVRIWSAVPDSREL